MYPASASELKDDLIFTGKSEGKERAAEPRPNQSVAVVDTDSNELKVLLLLVPKLRLNDC